MIDIRQIPAAETAYVGLELAGFLDPYVMGESLNLSPFAILVCLTVWAALWAIPARCRSRPW